MGILFRGIEAGESSVSGAGAVKNGSGGHGHRLAAPTVRAGVRRRTWLRRRPAGECVTPAMATDSTLFLWMGLGFGWQREGRGKMEARVAVDPPATGSGSTRSSDGDAMGANLTPDTCDDGGALAPSPLDLHPTSVWLCGLFAVPLGIAS